MKKITLLLLLFSTLSYGQSKAYVDMLESFKIQYNEANPQGVFDLMNKGMQEKVGLKAITTIVTSYNKYFGALKSFEFLEKEEALEVYAGYFEEGTRKISLVLDGDGKISGLLFKPLNADTSGKLQRNLTEMALPFRGEWFTFWGGDNKRQNYHVINQAQKGAFDFLILDQQNSSYLRSGTRNEDYYAFGKPLYAVCDAEVIEVITGVEDNRPGQMNPSQPSGNSVMLKTENGEYIVYSHFQQGSIKVKQRQVVRKGQYLGNCGNSGNSSEPHLHLHIQDSPNRLAAVGAYCYFEEMLVNGELLQNYSPIKGDRISLPKQ